MEQDPPPVIVQPAIGEPAPAPFAEPEPTKASVVAAPPKRSGGNATRVLNFALIGALVLAVAGIGFAAGRMTAPAASAFTGSGPLVVNGLGPGGYGRPGGGAQSGPIGITGSGGPSIEGTVESVTDTTLTIKTADGQTTQIALDQSTTYHSQTDASADDLVTGGKVLVRLNFQRGDGAAGGLKAGDVTVVP